MYFLGIMQTYVVNIPGGMRTQKSGIKSEHLETLLEAKYGSWKSKLHTYFHSTHRAEFFCHNTLMFYSSSTLSTDHKQEKISSKHFHQFTVMRSVFSVSNVCLDISVGTVTKLWAERRRNRGSVPGMDKRRHILPLVRIVSGVIQWVPETYRGSNGPEVKMTVHLHLVPSFSNGDTMTALNTRAFMECTLTLSQFRLLQGHSELEAVALSCADYWSFIPNLCP